jgi:hypothetical protein
VNHACDCAVAESVGRVSSIVWIVALALSTSADVTMGDPRPVTKPLAWIAAAESPPPEAGAAFEGDEAVVEGLAWLARHQSAEGSWSVRGHSTACGVCPPGPGSEGLGVGITALCILAFQGAGYTSLSKDVYRGKVFGQTVGDGLDYLASKQREDGGFDGARGILEAALAAAALAMEARFAPGSRVVEPSRRAAGHLAGAKAPGGGWGYEAGRGPADAITTGWAAFALSHAREAGLLAGALDAEIVPFLNRLTARRTGRTGYREAARDGALIRGANDRFAANPTCTAAAIVSRILVDRNHRVTDFSSIQLDVFAASPPRAGEEFADHHYWFWSGLAMFYTHGPSHPIWKRWAASGIAALRDRQCRARGSCGRGSFDPTDKWSFAGGRVYATAMAVLALEVYGRYPNLLSVRAP